MPPHSYVDTPVMRQYLEVKEQYPDCTVFFQVGDFYEMFFDDAVVASRALDLVLTSRDKNKEDGVPMCGFPLQAAKLYIGKLVALGKKVALCEQVEDATKTNKIVRRAVTQVITPGVMLEEDQLSPKSGHYLCVIIPGSGPATGQAGLSYLDVSTGEFAATQLSHAAVVEELARIEPAELLVRHPVPDDLAADLGRLRLPSGPVALASDDADQALLVGLLGDDAVTEIDRDDLPGAPRLSEWPLALKAAAAAARYAQGTQRKGRLPLTRLRLYRHGDEMVIDETTKSNLELFQTLMERRQKGALLGLLDETRTAMGGRLLRRWLGAPLLQVAAIRRRHDAVEWLVERHALRDTARKVLGEIHDLERLIGRISLSAASPRDLYCLEQSLRRLPGLRDAFAQAATGSESVLSPVPALLTIGEDLCGDVADLIEKAIAEEPSAAWREGGFIRRGHSADLDELLDISQGGKAQILRIEEREKERTGISSLKVRYNRVFGYYLEITRSHLAKVPSDYIRKQTLANAERYVTAELSEYEAKVLGAEERRLQVELELFEVLRMKVAAEAARVLGVAERLAQLDALAGLAEVAHRQGYVRPEVDESGRLEIEDGRHPIVEQLCGAGRFVPNDTVLDPEDAQMLIITGPNMAGKSTAMRQVALFCILSQMGSFVPARRAHLGVVDRVFTRVGAADNLSRGESTFMVEMRETANILRHASPRSLVVLDEIGRGTSTYDGLSIAWAVSEYLHDIIRCKTLFATHYHELCALAESRPRVRNLSVAVREWEGEIVFLHKLVAGGASRSYGIEVARLAGLPKAVLDRSREVLKALEMGPEEIQTPVADATPDGSGAAQGGGAAQAGEVAQGGKVAQGSVAQVLPVHGAPPVNSHQLALFHLVDAAQRAAPGRRRAAARSRAVGEAADSSAGPAVARPAGLAVHGPDPREVEVLARLRQADCDGMTPRDALLMVAELCERLRIAGQAAAEPGTGAPTAVLTSFGI